MGRRDGGMTDFFLWVGQKYSSFYGTDFTSESAKTSGVGKDPPTPTPGCAARIGYDE